MLRCSSTGAKKSQGKEQNYLAQTNAAYFIILIDHFQTSPTPRLLAQFYHRRKEEKFQKRNKKEE